MNIKKGKGVNYIVPEHKNRVIHVTHISMDWRYHIYENLYIDNNGDINYNIIDIPSHDSNYNVVWNNRSLI
jgi:hypothetical protein